MGDLGGFYGVVLLVLLSYSVRSGYPFLLLDFRYVTIVVVKDFAIYHHQKFSAEEHPVSGV